MTLRDDIRALQGRLGVQADGYVGPATIGAMRIKLDELAALKTAQEARTAPTLAGGASVGPDGVAPLGGALRASQAAIDLIHSFEQCRLTAYPDPGSANGEPWTIGWGSTGPDIKRGTVWTQAQADERFKRDFARFEDEVRKAVAGVPTTQSQFDALVSFHYNTGALPKSTLLKKHRAGDHDGAFAEFGRWIHNDGKIMKGLIRRRADEANLYRGQGNG